MGWKMAEKVGRRTKASISLRNSRLTCRTEVLPSPTSLFPETLAHGLPLWQRPTLIRGPSGASAGIFLPLPFLAIPHEPAYFFLPFPSPPSCSRELVLVNVEDHNMITLKSHEIKSLFFKEKGVGEGTVWLVGQRGTSGY